MLEEHNEENQKVPLEFIPTSNYNADTDTITINLNPNPNNAPLFTESRSQASANTNSFYGKTQDVFSKTGLSWLLETDDDDDFNKPLLEELDINISDIYYKIRCVLIPYAINRDVLMSTPDFWGPLFIVLSYSLIILWGQFRVVSWVLTVWFLGSFLIFALARVLGAEVTYAQSLGVIGYSLLPILLSTLFVYLQPLKFFLYAVQFIGILWASYSAGSLIISNNVLSKRVLLVYPIFLLYVYFVSLASGV